MVRIRAPSREFVQLKLWWGYKYWEIFQQSWNHDKNKLTKLYNNQIELLWSDALNKFLVGTIDEIDQRNWIVTSGVDDFLNFITVQVVERSWYVYKSL